jgi:hypothetical protein
MPCAASSFSQRALLMIAVHDSAVSDFAFTGTAGSIFTTVRQNDARAQSGG